MRFNQPVLVLAMALAGLSGEANGQQADDAPKPDVKVYPSEFRPNVDVEYLYNQDIEGVYTTTWLGREEKREGPWRDIYFETSEKYVAKGILSFQCFANDTNGDPSIGVFEYGSGDFGDPDAARVTKIDIAQRQAWMDGKLDSLLGESPPYELYVIAHYRFCGDGREPAAR
jgi:hypothetical protein